MTTRIMLGAAPLPMMSSSTLIRVPPVVHRAALSLPASCVTLPDADASQSVACEDDNSAPACDLTECSQSSKTWMGSSGAMPVASMGSTTSTLSSAVSLSGSLLRYAEACTCTHLSLSSILQQTLTPGHATRLLHSLPELLCCQAS